MVNKKDVNNVILCNESRLCNVHSVLCLMNVTDKPNMFEITQVVNYYTQTMQTQLSDESASLNCAQSIVTVTNSTS